MASAGNAAGHAEADERDGEGTMPNKRKRMEQLIEIGMGLARVQEAQQELSQPPTSSSMAMNGDHGHPSSASPHGHTSQRSDDGTCLVAASAASKAHVPKRTWAEHEDAKLLELVATHGRNWAVIATKIRNRDRKRCRERFMNHLDPSLRHVPWSQAEDQRLMVLYQESGSQWARIAELLTGRSPEDAKNRWLRLTNNEQKRAAAVEGDGDESESPPPATAPAQRWTGLENEALRALVDANGAKDWFFIASQIPGRTDLQCCQHWYRVLAPSTVKGRATWTSEEDEILCDKVQELGHKWVEIATFLPGRLGKQCRERYRNQLDPSINNKPWTSEEDTALVTAQRLHGNGWALIMQQLPGRAENAVKNRWNALRRKSG